MQIYPVTRQYIHKYLAEPLLQGCELFNLAWEGKDRCLIPNNLSLKERLIYCLQGALLLLFPLINVIIWLVWKTFGNPKKI